MKRKELIKSFFNQLKTKENIVNFKKIDEFVKSEFHLEVNLKFLSKFIFR